MSARCGSCGAPIVWATTTGGKHMPLDAAPVADGNVAAHRDGGNGALIARVLKDGEAPAPWEVRGTSHFSTCPDAGQHRRKRDLANYRDQEGD